MERQAAAARRLVIFCSLAAVLQISMPALQAQQNPAGVPQIDHFPSTVGIEGKPISIEARVLAPGRTVVYLRLYYKFSREQAFRFIDMRPAAQGFVGQIPAFASRPPAVQYFLVALLSDRTVINYPTKNPYGQPFEILIRENGKDSIESAKTPKAGSEAKAPPKSSSPPAAKPPVEVSPQLLDKIEKLERPMAEKPADTSAAFAESSEPAAESLSPILILSPEPFSEVAPSDAVIAASFLTETEIDSASIIILLDGKNVTRRAQVSPAMVSYSPASIAAGEHEVIITASDQSGNQHGPVNWRFQVSGNAAPTTEEKTRRYASGIVYAEIRSEKFSGRTLNNNNLGADLSGNRGALRYSASAYFTSLEDKTLQPRNRFVLNAGLPWLNFTLGDATPYYDELILWGRRVRGFQASLNTGLVNLDFIAGQTIRQIDPLYVLEPDTINVGQFITKRQRFGTFQQNLLGLRPSFGSLAKRGFLWGFTLLKVRDDTNSLPTDSSNVVQVGRVTPCDNLVLGSDFSLAFDRRRFEVQASGAWSLLSNDISQGPLSADSLKKISDVDLPFNPQDFDNWFILNETTSPLDPTGKTSLAYQLALQFNYFNHFLSTGYKQLGSEYVSLGHSFLRNDIRGFFINDRWRMFRNRAYVTLGLESYDDHFNTIDGRPTTNLQTWQFGAAIFWNPNLPGLNLNFRNHSRDNAVDTTVVKNFAPEDNATRDFSMSLNYDVTAFNLDHTITLSVTNSSRVDNIKPTAAGAISGDVASNLKSISVRTRFQVPVTGIITYATNNNNIAGGQSLFKYNMFSGRVDYDFSQQRTEPGHLQMRAYAAFNSTGASGGTNLTTIPAGNSTVINYKQTGFQLGGAVNFKQQHELTLDLNLLNYKDRGVTQTAAGLTPNSSFTNSLIRAYYSYRF